MSLDELVNLCPPPAFPTDGYDVHRLHFVEDKYGVRFPKDYIDLCCVYGTGIFVSSSGHEINIYNPFREYYDRLVENNELAIEFFFAEELMAEQMRAQQFSVCSVFPLGCDTDESDLNWITLGEPDNWRLLLINKESCFFEIFDVSLTVFLANFVAGRLPVRGWKHRLAGGRGTYSFIPFQSPDQEKGSG